MGDARWVKFEVNMYDDTKLKILDHMDNRDLNQYVWTRLLVLTRKVNRGGYLYITDNMPYTVKTLAIEFNRSISEVKAAIKILIKLEIIELTEDKVFKIKNWEKHQNVEGMERYRELNRERVANHRAKKKEINENKNEGKVNNNIPEITEGSNQNKNNNDKIDNIDIQVEENTSDFQEEVFKDNPNYGNVTGKGYKNNTNDRCNVTSNSDNSNCNITVMEQIKKENKNKKEKKKESKSEFEINHESDIDKSKAKEINHDETHTDNFSDDGKKTSQKEKVNDFEQPSDCENKTNHDAAGLLDYYENITGIMGGLNIGSLKLAINMHGYGNVKKAINKSLEVNKANMTYINGILKNWRREGYPKDDMEVKTNGVRSHGKDKAANKNEFAGIKPKKSRNLTEAERRRAEEELI